MYLETFIYNVTVNMDSNNVSLKMF